MATVFIAIGSNVEPEEHFRQCGMMLRRIWGDDITFSEVYRTAAMEVEDQDDFLNAAARIETDMPCREVFARLQAIENVLEKAPPFKFGPRTIDLDLLLYDADVIDEEDLQVPHPRMHTRRFVLEPLSELVEHDRKHPALNKTLHALYQDTLDQNSVLDESVSL